MKKIHIIVILSLFLTACSPIPKSQSKGNPLTGAPFVTNVYPITYRETAEIAENVYIGEIISINDNPIIGFTYVSGQAPVETINIKMCEYVVQISEVLKGSFVETAQITDRILYSFKDYIAPGEKYIFCTGIDFAKPKEIQPVRYLFEPFEAIKINADESIAFCYDDSRMKNYEPFTYALPKNLMDIRGMVNEAIDHQWVPRGTKVNDIREINFDDIEIVKGSIQSVSYYFDSWKNYINVKVAVLTISILDIKPFRGYKERLEIRKIDEKYIVGDSCYYFLCGNYKYVITPIDTENWDYMQREFKNK